METDRPEPWEPRYTDSPDVAPHGKPLPGFGGRGLLLLWETLHAVERGAPGILSPVQGAVVIRGMPALFPYQLPVLLECGLDPHTVLLLSRRFLSRSPSHHFSCWTFCQLNSLISVVRGCDIEQ